MLIILGIILRFALVFGNNNDGLANSHVSSSSKSITERFWNKDRLISRTNVRLLKKSWKPKGTTLEEYVDVFPGTVEEAYHILRENTEYEYIHRPLSKAFELLDDTNFNRGQDTIILAHPLSSNGDDKVFTKAIITALAMRNIHHKYNILAYDMPKLNKNFFFTVLREILGLDTKYKEMAEVMSSFLLEAFEKRYFSAKNLHFIGYSYSGNLVGYIARRLKQFSNEKVSSLVCLDPFSAQYNENLIHVSRDDAEVVHILHTSSYVQGTRERIGTADFVFNDAFIQPECNTVGLRVKRLYTFGLNGPFVCSHLRIVPRFWYIILFPKKFMVRKCDTWQRFARCMCEENDERFISYPIVSRDIQGIYFLKTTGTKPYGLEDGRSSHCNPEEKEKLEKRKSWKKGN